MSTDLGALSLGLQIPGLAMLDALEARLAVMDRAQHTVTLGINTGAVTQAEQSVASLGTAHQALGSKSVALGMDVSQIESARTSVKNLDNDLLSLVTTAGKVGPALAAGVAIGGLTKFAADYQTTMVTTANNTTLANDEIAILDKTVRGLPSGGAPLADLATGFKNITDLGYSAADAQKIAAEESKAATESGANQATTMLAVTSAMKEYNATASEVGKYTNIIAEAAKLGNTTLQAWTEGTRQGTAVAAAYGVSLQEADAFMVALTRHGFDAAEASTQLRGVIQHIVGPSPKAEAEIATIKKDTGIDLSFDFSDAGLKARGFANVMADLQSVIDKTGDESIVAKLIPALRGGQGALITVTQAAADSKIALGDLNAAGTGAITPVADGFDRMSKTAGYQFGQTMKELKLDAIDLGNTFLPIATDIIGAFDKIPSGAVKMAADIGLAFAAIKGAAAVSDMLVASTAKLGTTVAGNATVLAADTVATEANTVAQTENVSAREAVAAKVAGMGKTLGSLIVPLSITLVAYEIIGKPVEDAIKNWANQLERPQANLGTLNTDSDQAYQDGINARIAEQQKIVDEYNKYKDSAGYKVNKIIDLGGETQADVDYKKAIQNIKDLQQAEADYQQAHHNITELGPPLPANYREPMSPLAASQAAYQKELEAGYGTSQMNADAKASDTALADYRKQLDKDVATARKQAQADAVKAEKDSIQEAADAQVAAATKSADAWKAANAEAGKVDISKGLASFGDAALGLDKVRDDLAAIGEFDPHLSAIASLADIFKGFGDEVKTAQAALDGYNLTLQQTDDAIKAIGSLKSEYLAALDAAQKRAANGTADASDQQIISMRSSVFGTLDQQTNRLQQQGNVDLIGKLTNLPDYAALDTHLRSIVAMNGGGQGIIAKVNLEKSQAESDLTQFENADRAAIVKIKADTKDAIANVDKFLAGIPSDKTTTVHVQYVDPQGKPLSASQIDNPGGPGAVSGTAPGSNAPPASGSGFTPINYSDYQKVLAQYPGSPIADPGSFSTLETVAQQAGIDPRVLMAIMQTESGYGTTSDKLTPFNNFGGMGVNDRGFGFDSGVKASDGGPEYAGYSDFKSFLLDISAWVKQNGTSFSNYQTADGGQGKNATMAGLDAALPAAPYSSTMQGGYGAAVNRATGYGPGDVALGSGQTPTGGYAPGASGPRQDIVNAAMKDIGLQDFVDQCEKWVEQKVQQATGERGATNTNEASATAAFNDAQSKGLVRPANQAPQAGDLVYYPDPNGGAGHVAIYVGAGQQISTWDKGDPNNPTNAAIHQEAIGPGARFVMVPGTQSDTTRARSAVPDAAQGYGPGTYNSTGGTGVPPSINATTGGTPVAAIIPPDFTKAAADLTAALAKLDPAAWKDVGQQFTNILPALTQMQEKKIDGGDPSLLTPTDKQNALNAATEQGLRYETAYAQLVYDVEHHTGNIAADTQNIANIVGGPMADGYAKAALASADIAAANAQIVQLQKDATALDEAHAAVVRQRTAEDQAASRQKTRDSWAAQDAQNRLQDQQNAENVRYTQIQRAEQDQQRQLQFSQQVQATDLQNKLTDLQKQQQSTIYQRTSQEQLVAASAQGASTNAGAASQAAILAAMHNQDLAQKDLNTKAIDDIQLQIREQAKAANLESYNLQTETIAEQRKHENAMQGFTQEGTAMQRAAQQQQRDDQIAQWQLQDKRQIEDQTYADAKDANAKAQEAQKQILIAAQASLDAANQALTVWQQTGAVIVAAATNAANLPSYINSTAQLTGVNTIRNLGGYAAGGNITSPLALVGEYGPEIIHAPGYGVIPAAKTAQLLSSAGGSSGPTVNITGDINVMAGNGDAWMAEARAKFEARLQEVKRELERKGLAAKNKNGIRT